ncbi:hypothetical protein, partial [Halalkalibaculum sp. DA384]|uniref:hypothetical protein n=1 Tax=Halalkalibaculum sp. DA384 TaxID=3373606 RepID=UPI003754DB76
CSIGTSFVAPAYQRWETLLAPVAGIFWTLGACVENGLILSGMAISEPPRANAAKARFGYLLLVISYL